MWTSPPFEPRQTDGWLFGRGAGDMKSGLVACLAALDAIERAGFRPTAEIIVQSVVEEECTGNGALACLERSCRRRCGSHSRTAARAALERTGRRHLVQVKVRGIPVHVANAGQGVNAIESAYKVIAALHELEENWNARKSHYPSHAGLSHPINLNVGRIAGGDWASSVPAWCVLEVRVLLYPDPGEDAKREIEDRSELAARLVLEQCRSSLTTGSKLKATCSRMRRRRWRFYRGA